jgi:DNA (cytosine-5)-methyltransferase 1
MRTIDLFSGCGGMSLGFSRAGFDVVAAFDAWQLAIDSYRKNFKHPAHIFDLRNVRRAIEAVSEYRPDAIIGGPPCQDFSIAGKRVEASQASLSVAFARIACGAGVRLAVMENVYSIADTRTLGVVKRIFAGAGYGLTERVIDASLTGVPQMRRRFFLVAAKRFADEAFGKCLDEGLADHPMTVADYFGDRLGTEYYYAHPRNYKRRAVFSIHEPSATIRRVNRPIPGNYKSHPADKARISRRVRVLTTEERAEIQTFPRSFHFLGTGSQREHLIANAVPVRLAEYVAKRILKVLASARTTRSRAIACRH